VEIMSFNQATALVVVSELRLPQKIKDIVAVNEGNEAFAIVTTGRYLYRIRITDPKNMEVVLRHDNYQYSKGRIRTGSIESLATNGKLLFTSGQYGVRSMGLTNLIVNKYYHYDKSYGVAVNGKTVTVLGEQKAYTYHLVTGKKLMETPIKNDEKLIRRPAVNGQDMAYAISDNAVIKMFNGKVVTYANPAQKVSYSYAAATAGKSVYYVNGFGVTKFDAELKKSAFLKTSITSRFGDRAWAAGVISANINGGEKVIVFNKSSIVVMSPNLSVISQYKGNNNIQYNPGFSLSFDKQYLMTNQAVTARMTGFWPNESVKVMFAGKVYQVKANNLGESMLSFTTPGAFGRFVFDISAGASGTTYQQTKDIR
jgi:hypothetical protein